MDWKSYIIVLIFLCGIIFLGLYMTINDFWLQLVNLCIGIVNIAFAINFFWWEHNAFYS